MKDKILAELQLLGKVDSNVKITRHFLNKYKDNVIFVFGDNNKRQGLGGQAKIGRMVKNSYGFITKKEPSHTDNAYYKPKEYETKFAVEMRRLCEMIRNNPDKYFLIPTLGNGLANRYNIWEHVIRDNITILKEYNNVIFLYEV